MPPEVVVVIVICVEDVKVPPAGAITGATACKVKVAETILLSVQPVRKARARRVVVAVIGTGAEYCVDAAVGSVPFVV